MVFGLLLAAAALSQEPPNETPTSLDEIPPEPLAPVDPPPEATVAPSNSIRLVYTGGSQGIGSGRYKFSLTDELQSLDDTSLTSVVAHQGVLARGPWVLVSPDERVGTLVAFLEGEVTCGPPAGVVKISTPHEEGFVLSKTADWARPLDSLAGWVGGRPT